MDPRTVIEGAFALASFFAALFIRGVLAEMRGMREDFKALVKTVTDHGERIAVIESQVTDLRRVPK